MPNGQSCESQETVFDLRCNLLYVHTTRTDVFLLLTKQTSNLKNEYSPHQREKRNHDDFAHHRDDPQLLVRPLNKRPAEQKMCEHPDEGKEEGLRRNTIGTIIIIIIIIIDR